MPAEESCGDEISSAESDKDKVFADFSFFQAVHSRHPKSNVVNPSLILLDSESMACTFSNAKLMENIHPHEEGK